VLRDTFSGMANTLRAKVVAGRLTLDEPVDLPEGTVVDLMLADEDDDLDDEERRRLSEALDRAEREVADGKVIPASEVLARIRRR
jgi:RNA polymerase-interacting CarD/CdnL/TRCF family regulator